MYHVSVEGYMLKIMVNLIIDVMLGVNVPVIMIRKRKYYTNKFFIDYKSQDYLRVALH